MKPLRAILWILPEPPQNPGTGGALRTYWVIRSVRNRLPGVRHYGLALDDVKFPEGLERARALFDELHLVRPRSEYARAERVAHRFHESLAPRELADCASWWRYGLRDLYAHAAPFLLHHREVDVVHLDHLQLAPLLPRLRRFTRAHFALTAHNTYTLLAGGEVGPARSAIRRVGRRLLGAAAAAANLAPFGWYEGSRGAAASGFSKLLGPRAIAARSKGLALAMDAWATSKADHVFCMSAGEVALVREFGTAATLAPNGASALDLAELAAARTARRDRQAPELTYAFVGHGSYLPYRAACALMVRAFADDTTLGRLRLVGLGMEQAARELPDSARCRNLTVVDGPPDVRPHLAEADAALMPIFAGSGTRLKAMEAVFAGLPLVASRKAVEGLDLDPAEDCALVESPTPAGVAAAVRRFAERRDHFIARARALRERWVRTYDWQRTGDEVAGALCAMTGSAPPEGSGSDP